MVAVKSGSPEKYRNAFFFNNIAIFIFISVFAIVHICLILKKDLTSSDLDSINHYLYARWAFKHPLNFVAHWGKPFFTLLASPFCQFGFVGIKSFNLLLSVLTLYFTHLFCRAIAIQYSIIPVIILGSFIFFNQAIHSGLTEPLGSFLLLLSSYLIIKNKNIAAVIIISFYPFVRSEGLILLFLFALYLIVVKKSRYIPFLVTGHIIYSLLGHLFFGKNWFWVFTEIPYMGGSVFGKGGIFDFYLRMPLIIGFFCFGLLNIGVLYLFILNATSPKYLGFEAKDVQILNFLVFLPMLSIFGFHSVVWFLGIFQSAGLMRVITIVMPQIAIVCGLPILDLIRRRGNPIGTGLLFVLLISAYNMVDLKYGLFVKNKFSIPQYQLNEYELSYYIKINYPFYKSNQFVCLNPYFAYLLDLDVFDTRKYKRTYNLEVNSLLPGAFVIWDNTVKGFGNKFPSKALFSNSKLNLAKGFYIYEHNQLIYESELYLKQ